MCIMCMSPNHCMPHHTSPICTPPHTPSSLHKVVRGVLLSRGSAIRDDEDDQLPIPYPTSTEGLQDLLRTIPQDLFRTTLANVLMVTFDIMSSHHRMVTWHREALERHAVELSRIQRYKNDIKQRSGSVTPSPRGGGGVGGSTTPSTPSGEGGGHGGHAAVHGGVASPHAATTPASPRTPTLRMGQRVAHMTTRAGGDVLQQPATGGVHGNEEEEEDAGEMSLDAQLQVCLCVCMWVGVWVGVGVMHAAQRPLIHTPSHTNNTPTYQQQHLHPHTHINTPPILYTHTTGSRSKGT